MKDRILSKTIEQEALAHGQQEETKKSNRSLGLFAAAMFSLAVVPALRAADLTPYQQMGRDIYKQLIETDTTHSTGDTTKAAKLMAERFRAAGFPAEDINIVGPRSTNQNLVVRYRGTGARQPVVLIAHLDVVEARREDWTYDPFVLTEKDGYFYGRGSLDDKSGDATLSSALLRLREEGFKPDRDIILAMTSGEEAAADYNGMEWLTTNRQDLINGVICLNADSGGPALHNGKVREYGIQAAEKVYLSFWLEAKGPGGHSSRPTKDNPIYEVSEALVRLSKFDFPVDLNEITRDYFDKASKLESGQLAADMKGVLKNPPYADAVKRLSESPYNNALLRTTGVATMMTGGHAENALPQTARATVNCRILPWENPDDIEKTIRRVVADTNITITRIEPPRLSPPSPLSQEILGAVQTAKEKLWPGVPVIAKMETGATDGLYFRQRGIPTYGITGVATDPDDSRMHGKDERVGVKAFYDALEYEYQLIKAISSK